MESIHAEKFSGCLLGLALGDAWGAPLEGGAVERLIWSLIGRSRDGRRRWTDDTQMALDIAESLLAKGELDADDLAIRFARSYRWSRGYGRGASRLLRRIRRGESWSKANRSVFRDGSYGNGGAMRAPVIGLFYASDADELVRRADESARITHEHPLAREGAVLVASATAAALETQDPAEILAVAAGRCSLPQYLCKLETVSGWLGTERSPLETRRILGNGVAAQDSCVTSLYISLSFLGRPFAEMCAYVGECGGDTDTIGAMAGAIWGAANGSRQLPESWLGRLEASEFIRETAAALHRAANYRAATVVRW